MARDRSPQASSLAALESVTGVHDSVLAALKSDSSPPTGNGAAPRRSPAALPPHLDFHSDEVLQWLLLGRSRLMQPWLITSAAPEAPRLLLRPFVDAHAIEESINAELSWKTSLAEFKYTGFITWNQHAKRAT